MHVSIRYLFAVANLAALGGLVPGVARPAAAQEPPPSATPQTVATVAQALTVLGHANDYKALLNERDYPAATFRTLDRRNADRPRGEQILLFSLQNDRPVNFDEFVTVVKFPVGFTPQDLFARMQHGLDYAVMSPAGQRGQFYLKFSSWDGSGLDSFLQPPGSQVFSPGTILQPRHRLDIGIRDVALSAAAGVTAKRHPFLSALSLALPTVRSGVVTSTSGGARFLAAETDEYDVIVADVLQTADHGKGYVRYATLWNPQDKRLDGQAVNGHVLHGGRIYGYEQHPDGTTTLFSRGVDQWRSDAESWGLTPMGNYYQQQAWLTWLEDADRLVQALGGEVLVAPRLIHFVTVKDVRGAHLTAPAKYIWSPARP